MWPSQSNKTEAELTIKLTSEVSVKKRTFANGGSRLQLEHFGIASARACSSRRLPPVCVGAAAASTPR